MSYTISLGKTAEAAVIISLDSPYPTAIPPFVAVGVGDKRKRYVDWLDNCFISNTRLLNFLAEIHRLGTEKGSIALVSNGHMRLMQMECVRDFLVNNKEMLDNILPYIFHDVKHMTDVRPEEDKLTMPAELSDHLSVIKDLPKTGQLMQRDMDIIQDLIRKDQAINNASQDNELEPYPESSNQQPTQEGHHSA